MLLVEEKPDFEFYLRGADGREAWVNDRRLVRSFIVSPSRLIEDWPVPNPDSLVEATLAPLLSLAPEVVLLGTGARQAFPPPAAMAAFLTRGIGIECMANAAAARTYDVLAGEGRQVVAGFILPGG